jgi:hypothetical protein
MVPVFGDNTEVVLDYCQNKQENKTILKHNWINNSKDMLVSLLHNVDWIMEDYTAQKYLYSF